MKGLALFFFLCVASLRSATAIEHWTLANGSSGLVGTIAGYVLVNNNSVTFQTIDGFPCAGKFSLSKTLQNSSGGFMTAMQNAHAAYQLEFNIDMTATPAVADIFCSFSAPAGACAGLMNIDITSGDKSTWESNGGDCQDLTSANTFPHNAWNRIDISFDGTTKRLYKNGVLDASAVDNADYGNSVNNFLLGAYIGGGFSLGNGYLRDVTFWDGADCTQTACVGYPADAVAPNGSRSPWLRNQLKLKLGSFLPALFFMPEELQAISKNQILEQREIKSNVDAIYTKLFKDAVSAGKYTLTPTQVPKTTPTASFTSTTTPSPDVKATATPGKV